VRKVRETSMVMRKKKRITLNEAERKGRDVLGRPEGGGLIIKSEVLGQLKPLDRIAREKVNKWGDTLPTFVPPEMAGRFEAAYDALTDAVEANDVMTTNQIAGQLMRAWDVLEKTALEAGHKPPAEDCYCIELDGERIVCIASKNAHVLREKYKHWIVYSFEDVARILSNDFTAKFLEAAYDSFPKAKITTVIRDGVDQSINWEIGDEIPW
jgi:hypothetical protein|tara:strand:+ start:1906 stop:2538 length:633 start_codon:yes stop_codon:yes gene_type:complete